jgi:hypothetical protein
MKKTNIDHLNSHGTQLSRRQFVGLGLVGASSTLLAPSFFSMLSSSAFAGQDPLNPIAYLGFDLAGGAAMPGNFLVGGAGGPEDLLKSYDLIGWNPRVNGYDDRFGLPMPKANIGKIFEGLTTTMSEGAQKNFRMGSFSHVSRDDTSDNPLSIIELLSSMNNMGGSKSQKGLGMTSAASGGNSRGVKSISQYSPTKILSVQDITNITKLSVALEPVPGSLKSRMFKTMQNISNSQSKRLFGLDAMPDAMNSSFTGLEQLVGGTFALDPRQIADIQTIYGINANTQVTNVTATRAGIVNCVLARATGPGVITIGGCDYHDGTQTTGDAKDLEIGREIGRAIELAHQRKVPLFIHIYSDGGVGARQGSRMWGSDSGEQSLTVIGYYDPKGVPSYSRKDIIQIGHYTAGQGADRETLIGGNPALVSYAVLANYMNLMGNLDQFNTYAPSPFSEAELNSILIFGKS